MSSEYTETIFGYDLDAYGISVKTKDFRSANIFANRIMSNSSLFDSKQFGIIGHILKEIANDGIKIQMSKDDKMLLDYSQKSSKVVGTVVKMLATKKIILDDLWSAYNQHQISTHTMFMSPSEKIAYVKLDETFSNNTIKQLITILEKDISFLEYPTNDFLRGILNESSRLSKVHGLQKSDEHFMSLLMMLQRIDIYIKHTAMKEDFIERTQKETIPLASEIIKIYHLINNTNDKSDEIDDLLWKLIKIWRNYFIKFMEIEQSNYSIREQKSNKEDLEKSELVEEVTKYIEADMGE